MWRVVAPGACRPRSGASRSGYACALPYQAAFFFFFLSGMVRASTTAVRVRAWVRGCVGTCASTVFVIGALAVTGAFVFAVMVSLIVRCRAKNGQGNERRGDMCVPCASPSVQMRAVHLDGGESSRSPYLSTEDWQPFGRGHGRALLLTSRCMFVFFSAGGTGEDELVLHGVKGVHGGALRQPPEDDVRVPLLLGHLPPGVLRGLHGDVHDLLGEQPKAQVSLVS